MKLVETISQRLHMTRMGAQENRRGQTLYQPQSAFQHLPLGTFHIDFRNIGVDPTLTTEVIQADLSALDRLKAMIISHGRNAVHGRRIAIKLKKFQFRLRFSANQRRHDPDMFQPIHSNMLAEILQVQR